MPVIQAKRRIHYSTQRMFDLVADVERYPEFLPLCERHVIRSRERRGGGDILITDMTVAYQIFCITYRSHVTLDWPNGRILVESLGGPVRRLRTVWTFAACGKNCCDVGFDLSYQIESTVLALLVGGVLEAAFGRFVQAFERRADIVYGQPMRHLPRRTITPATSRPRLT